jgi:hypothetical protein
VDYATEGISGHGSNMGVTVFMYSVWMPKSVITWDEHGQLSCKGWFLTKGLANAHHIKRYFLNDKGEKAFV